MPDYRQELVDRYATTHGSHFAEKDAAWYAARARDFDRRLRPWLPADHGAPLLDLACGAGEFLVHAKALGYTQARGIDHAVGATAGHGTVVDVEAHVDSASTTER